SSGVLDANPDTPTSIALSLDMKAAEAAMAAPIKVTINPSAESAVRNTSYNLQMKFWSGLHVWVCKGQASAAKSRAPRPQGTKIKKPLPANRRRKRLLKSDSGSP